MNPTPSSTRLSFLVVLSLLALPARADRFYATVEDVGGASDGVQEILTHSDGAGPCQDGPTLDAELGAIPEFITGATITSPDGIAVRSDGRFVYVVNRAPARLLVINTDRTDANGDCVPDNPAFHTIVENEILTDVIPASDFFARDVAVTTNGLFVVVTGFVRPDGVGVLSDGALVVLTRDPAPAPESAYTVTHVLRLWNGGFEGRWILRTAGSPDGPPADGLDDGDPIVSPAIEVSGDFDANHIPWAVVISASNRVYFTCYFVNAGTLAGFDGLPPNIGPVYHSDVHYFELTAGGGLTTLAAGIYTAGTTFPAPNDIQGIAVPHQIEDPFDLILSPNEDKIFVSCNDNINVRDALPDGETFADGSPGAPLGGKVVVLEGGAPPTAFKGLVRVGAAGPAPPADPDPSPKAVPFAPAFRDPLGMAYYSTGSFAVVADRDEDLGGGVDVTGNIAEQIQPVAGLANPDLVVQYYNDPTDPLAPDGDPDELTPRYVAVALEVNGVNGVFLDESTAPPSARVFNVLSNGPVTTLAFAAGTDIVREIAVQTGTAPPAPGGGGGGGGGGGSFCLVRAVLGQGALGGWLAILIGLAGLFLAATLRKRLHPD